MEFGFFSPEKILKMEMSAYVFLYIFTDRDDRIRVVWEAS
jgi:hypothetical protein